MSACFRKDRSAHVQCSQQTVVARLPFPDHLGQRDALNCGACVHSVTLSHSKIRSLEYEHVYPLVGCNIRVKRLPMLLQLNPGPSVYVRCLCHVRAGLERRTTPQEN
jgi:hypothetical protein